MVKFVSPTKPAGEDYRKTLSDVKAREAVIKTKWLDEVKDIYDIYEGGKHAQTPFNILYSNTEILVPNIFALTPQPVVRKRFGELRADESAQAAERMAEYSMDTNLSGYPAFSTAVSAAVLDSALPGQGQCRIRVVDSLVCLDYIQHDAFIWGYAKRWEDVPWQAFRYDKTKEEIVKEFEISDEVAAKMTLPESEGASSRDDKGPPTVAVYEVWNKSTRMVHFLCEAHPDSCLRSEPDPLRLEGFFCSGEPLRLLSTPCSTMPRAMYGLYRRQAEELNAITDRIKKITQAIRVRGIYNGTLPEMAQIFDGTDRENSLIPSANPGNMMREGGLDKHIWLVPTEKLIIVLNSLIAAREQVKSTIYEILGIGDILRGVSAASETFGAQQIKDKWGSLRIKKSRERVSHFIRGNIRLMIEAAAKHVPEDTWAKVTGLPYLTQAQIVLMRAMPQAGVMTPGMQMPQQKTWGEVLGVLKDDLTRSYVVDIESNSTVDTDATQDREEVTEFMTALGQSQAALAGLSSIGDQGFEAAKALLIEICKRFRMGGSMQAVLSKLTPPPKGPTPEQQKMQEALEKREQDTAQGEEGLKATETQLKQQFDQQKMQLDQLVESIRTQKAALDQQAFELEKQAAELEQQKAALDLQERDLELQVREKTLELEQSSTETQQQLGQKELALQKNEVAFQGKQVQAQVEADAGGKTEAKLAEALKTIEANAKIVEALFNEVRRPVSIVKTGPGKFERVLGEAPAAPMEEDHSPEAMMGNLIKEMRKPVTVVKTGPGRFDRVVG